MYVDEKAPGEVQTPEQKLAAAIREGAKTLPEGSGWWHCALGTAAKGLGYGYISPINPESSDILDFLGAKTGMPRDKLHRISRMHFHGRVTRAEIADMLDRGQL